MSPSSQNSARKARASEAWLLGAAIGALGCASRVMGVNEHLEPPVFRLRDLRAQLLEVALELRDMRSNGSFGMAWTHLTPVQIALVARVCRNGVEYLFVTGHVHLVVEDSCCRRHRLV